MQQRFLQMYLIIEDQMHSKTSGAVRSQRKCWNLTEDKLWQSYQLIGAVALIVLMLKETIAYSRAVKCKECGFVMEMFFLFCFVYCSP